MDQVTKAEQLEDNVIWNVYNFTDNMQLNWLLTCKSEEWRLCVVKSHMDGLINVMVILT